MQIKVDTSHINIDKYPNKCPKCHHAISPIFSSAINVEYNEIDVALKCTNCNNMFIGKYRDISHSRRGDYRLSSTYPIIPKEINFEKEIEETSPLFVKTYNQSLYAESSSLNQLTGIGLRKSLEYLIKDFLISQYPDKKESIKKSSLAQCIENFIEDTNLKEVSKRATWLGNDETHYVKKWENKDINDLKILIKLTVNWIHNILLTNKYIEEMK